MLGALYHIPPTLPFDKVRRAKKAIDLLLKVADMYGCVSLLSTPIEKHLNLFHDEVLQSCTFASFDMLELSMKLKCPWIFKETMAHLVCKDEGYFENYKEVYKSLGIVELISKKRAAFTKLLSDTERSIITGVIIGDYGDITGILAVSYFRDWFLRKLNAGQGSSLRDDAYSRLYRRIGSGQVPRSGKLATFLKPWRMSGVSTPGFREGVEHAFANAKVLVEPVLRDTAINSRDWAKNIYRPLTCIEIGDDDLPWKDKP